MQLYSEMGILSDSATQPVGMGYREKKPLKPDGWRSLQQLKE